VAFLTKRTYRAKLPSGKVVTRRVKHWTIVWRDGAGKLRRKKAYPDKAASQQLMAKLQVALAWGETDLVNPYKTHKATPTAQHVADFIAHLEAKGCSAKYATTMRRRLTILIDECGWAYLPDVTADTFLRWRQRQKSAPRNGTRKDRDSTSAATLNQYLASANAFCNWLVRPAKRIAANPLAGVDKAEGEKVRNRRALSDDEVSILLAVAPADRAIVYRVALSVGLRRSELAALKWGDIGLVAVPAFIQLRAEATKARRGDRVYLPATLAEELRKAKPEDATGNDRVFPAVPDLTAWQEDLAAARKRWVGEAKTPKERRERERSDVLTYRDAMGRQVDFHAGTRKTLCTRLHRAGQPLALAMRVMRHTDARLTLVDYTDDDRLGLAGAVLAEVPAAPAVSSAGGQAIR